MQRFFELISQKAFLILFIILSITVFFAAQLPKLHVDTSIMRMLVEDIPAKREYDRYREEFGGASDAIVVVSKAEDVFSPEAFQTIGELTRGLSLMGDVNRVVSLATLKDDLDILNEWTLEDFRRNINQADLFVRNMVSPDGKTTALLVILKKNYDLEATAETVETILKGFRTSSDPLQIYQIGTPIIGHALTRYTEKDFKTLPFFTMLVIFLVLVFCFRDLRGAFVPFAAVCFTLVWTFGLMGLLNIPLSMVNMIIPTLLIAVGSAYAMHIMAVFFNEAPHHEKVERAVVKSLLRVSVPTLLASVTTIVSFASLILNRIATVREFAVFSCLGLLFMVIIHLTFIPAALCCCRPPKDGKKLRRKEASWIATLLKKVVWTIQHYPKSILVTAAAISLFGCAGLLRIKVETTPISFFKDSSDIKTAFHDVHEHLAGIYPINVVLRSSREGYFAEPEALRKVEDLQDFLTKMAGVDLALSIVDLLKFEGLLTRNFRNKEDDYVVPSDPFGVREAIRNYRRFEAGDLVDRFVSEDFSRVNIVCRSNCESTADFMEAEKKIRPYIREHFSEAVDFDVTGLCIVGSHSAHAMTVGQIQSLGLALICIFIILSTLFLSPRVGSLAMIPNLFPIIVNFGIMGWLGIHLTVATSLVASIAIGLAVDDSIHYIFRFREQFLRDYHRREANYRTIADIGKPIVFTSIAIGLGFSILLFSNFVPTSIFGSVMIITMVSALFGDLFILPIIMQSTPWLLVLMERGFGSYRKIPLFNNLSLSEARHVVLAGVREHCRPGEIIFQRGDFGRGMYLILQGRIKLDAIVDTEDKDLAFSLGQGRLFGEIGISKPRARPFTATALEETILLHISDHMLNKLEQDHPKIAFTLYLNLMASVEGKLEIRGESR